MALSSYEQNIEECVRIILGTAVGERVMESLKALDHVAYVRFASVYRSFQDLAEFRDAIESLEAEPTKGDSQ